MRIRYKQKKDLIFYGIKLRLRFVECGKARRELRFFLV